MVCNGLCIFCPNPCKKEVVILEKAMAETMSENLRKLNEVTPVEQLYPVINEGVSSTDVAVVESAGHYEVVKNIFGKEKVRKVK